MKQIEASLLGPIAERIGGSRDQWQIQEIGDGNVNLIFRIQGPKGQVLVKQAVPYLRCVGEAWPLSVRRAFFEYTAIQEHAAFAPEFLPKTYHYDENSSAVLMEFLGEHIILRKGLIQGVKYPKFAEHISEYMARTLFFTSDLYLSAAEKKKKMALFCENTDLCKITEDLIFTDPYRASEQNRWTRPHLDAKVAALQNDRELKLAVTELKLKFLGSAEALIHGDLHSGSIMANANETKVIDPEFGFYGPMGFDTGLLFANLFMAYFSQAGWGSHPDARVEYEAWLLGQVQEIWHLFEKKFTALWDTDLKGDGLSKNLYGGDRALMSEFRSRYMARLFKDTVGFAAAEMIRRTVGLAHVADLDEIKDAEQRALCESRNLTMAREMMVNADRYTTVEKLCDLARATRALKSAGV